MDKLHFNKLVRDLVPGIIADKGAQYSITTLTDSQFKKELSRKVVEEASAFNNELSRDDVISELADISIVIEEIKKVYSINEEEFTEIVKNNLAKKGGFKERIFLEWTTDDGYITNETTN